MRKALFLDRDGVITKEINYLYKIGDFEFIDEIFDTCRFFAERGYLIIVITNQAGIGRGYYSEEEFLDANAWMENEFKKHQVTISKTYYCPYHPTEGVGRYKKDSFDRKPKPGMILKARDDFNIDLKASILVGDTENDIEAGLNAGVGTNILVRSGHEVGPITRADQVIDSVKDLPKVLKFK